MPVKRTEMPLERILMSFTYNYTWSLSSFVLAALESLYDDFKWEVSTMSEEMKVKVAESS